MRVLLTGGIGYIGAHVTIALAKNGHQVVIIDSCVTSDKSSLLDIENILGMPIDFIQGDVRDTSLLKSILEEKRIDAVIHLAGLKSVNDSIAFPNDYYSNNFQGSLSVVEAMNECNVKKLIFSSSATVYGHAKYLPIDEMHPLQPMNPYGKSKLWVEDMLHDVSISDTNWNIVVLRYFNPVGAHSSGLIGDRPLGNPSNLMPFVSRVAKGILPELVVFGDDYQTHDGSALRDYIHVEDLADGHLAAIEYLKDKPKFEVFNLGTGVSYSVLELIHTYEKVISREIQFKFSKRRDGDLPISYASAQKASEVLNWRAQRSLYEMCRSAWEFENKK